MRWIGKVITWLAVEYMKDYRESKARVFDTIVQNNLRLNTIILTVSIASLTVVAALNGKIFVDYPWPSIIVIVLFILVILFSTINFFLSGLALSDFQRKINKDFLLPLKLHESEYELKYQRVQKILNILVLYGFCLGLLVLLGLLGCYVLEVA